VVDAILEHCTVKAWTAYAIATDPTHVHALLGWRVDAGWSDVRRGIKSTISRTLNRGFGRRQWLSEGGSRKQVSEPSHFEHLRRTYLPSHRGVCWDRDGMGG